MKESRNRDKERKIQKREYILNEGCHFSKK